MDPELLRSTGASLNVRTSRRRVLSGIGGLAIARLVGGSASVFAQSTATPVAPGALDNFPFNLSAIGPLPIDDLKDYGYTDQTLQSPGAYYDYAAYLGNSFPVGISKAVADFNPEFAYAANLVTPATNDVTTWTRTIATLAIVASAGSPDWDGLFASVSGGAPAPGTIGERSVVWSYDTTFIYTTPPAPTKGTALLFTRGGYAHLIAIVDAKKSASADEISAIAKTIDDRLATAVSGGLTSATRPWSRWSTIRRSCRRKQTLALPSRRRSISCFARSTVKSCVRPLNRSRCSRWRRMAT